MKNALFFLIFLGFQGIQSQVPFSLSLHPISFPDLPGIQSFVFGQTSDGKVVVLGGRLDGLHRRMPFAAFDPAENNRRIYVVDIPNKNIWSQSILSLPATLAEQLQSTNMEFFQDGPALWLVGGYGYSDLAGEFVTYPYLTRVDVDLLARGIMEGNQVEGAFSQLEDPRFEVTGGQLQKIGTDFYLVGGQKFEGRYNPMGPDHGPGFFQEYTHEIRKFQLDFTAGNIQVSQYEAWHDETNLHRRDLNVLPQIFPDGSEGLTLFSGVFQHNVDLPFLNTINITSGGYEVQNDFSQLFNQYHTATTSLFSRETSEMYNLFFGGIGQYYLDANNNLVNDEEVPFVKTISVVIRNDDGNMQEWALAEKMPAYLGASAEFIPRKNIPHVIPEIIDLDQIPADSPVSVGYILGGIESTLPHVLFLNGTDLSIASDRLFEVRIQKGVSGIRNQVPAARQNPFSMLIKPNPADTEITVQYEYTEQATIWWLLQDSSGRIVKSWSAETPSPGKFECKLDLSGFPAGIYQLSGSTGKHMRSAPLILR